MNPTYEELNRRYSIALEIMNAQRVELDALRRELVSHREKAQGNYWAYDPTGENHLESLVTHCPVLIQAETLREIIEQRDAAQKACAAKDAALNSALAAVWDGHYSGKGVEIAYAQAIDREIKHALSLDCGQGFIPVKELEPTIELLPKLRDKVLHRSDCESVASHRRKSGRPNNVCTCGAVDLIAASNSIISYLEALRDESKHRTDRLKGDAK